MFSIVVRTLAVLTAAGVLAFGLTPSSSAAPGRASVLDLRDLDRTCPACRDFYQFSTGGWRAQHPIPKQEAVWGRFNTVDERNLAILHGILDRAAADRSAPDGSTTQKIGAFYRTCMDVQRVDRAGLEPLRGDLAAVDAIDDRRSLERELASLQLAGVDVLFSLSPTQDPKNATRVIGEIDQGGLGLPDRDYYLTAVDAKLRRAYHAHVERMFALGGDDAQTARESADRVVAFETAVARASVDRVTLRDPHATYHPGTAATLRRAAPSVDWPLYFNESGVAATIPLNIPEPSFVRAVSRLIAATPLTTMKAYLRWHVIHAYAPELSAPIERENFAFYSHTLVGTQEQQPRWKRCTRSANALLGEAVGKAYVEQAFSPAAKARAVALVDNLQATLRDDIATLPWMSASTRAYAERKLAAYRKKIGYPARFRDYANYRVADDSYAANVERGRVFESRRELAKIGKPLDRGEWGMPPATVNAYYDPEMNEIVFPAGILQVPFFDPNADDALNYGAIGMVIGHEMTHGFDDEGRQYDAVGNLRNWWTAADAKRYVTRSSCIVRQFDDSVAVGSLHENGKLVVGEATADLGGMTIAYRAYERSLRGKPRPARIDGFTPEQRFFLGFGRIWASNERPELMRLAVKTDPHPVDRLRVNDTVENMPEFAQAWHCTLHDAMVRPPAARCEIW